MYIYIFWTFRFSHGACFKMNTVSCSTPQLCGSYSWCIDDCTSQLDAWRQLGNEMQKSHTPILKPVFSFHGCQSLLVQQHPPSILTVLRTVGGGNTEQESLTLIRESGQGQARNTCERNAGKIKNKDRLGRTCCQWLVDRSEVVCVVKVCEFFVATNVIQQELNTV